MAVSPLWLELVKIHIFVLNGESYGQGLTTAQTVTISAVFGVGITTSALCLILPVTAYEPNAPHVSDRQSDVSELAGRLSVIATWHVGRLFHPQQNAGTTCSCAPSPAYGSKLSLIH